MALEMIEVTLSADDQGRALSLLRPGLLDAERRASLAERHPVASCATVEALLDDLITELDDVWRRSWLRACALHLIGIVHQQELVHVVRFGLSSSISDVAATAAWAVANL